VTRELSCGAIAAEDDAPAVKMEPRGAERFAAPPVVFEQQPAEEFSK
jgi:hypothetical protein